MRVFLATAVLALAAAPATGAGVRIVEPFDPAEYADRAAVGLLVPGAGPTVTREGALAALLRGRVQHSLLGGLPEGEPLLRLGEPGDPEILVSLPPPGTSENDGRYPIALLGGSGLLTSDSTRIDGLVSITDVATGRLREVDSADAAAALDRLDDRIDRNDSWRLPLTLLLAAAALALAAVRPVLALRALLVALALNLWLEPWIAVAAVAGAALLPLGPACVAVLATYLLTLGLRPEAVALSPLGPSQSGRFYGINNLLETLLLLPSLLGAALMPRYAIGVAALALVTIGGNRFGADGGGVVVLLAGYAVLWLRTTGRRPTPRLLALGAAGVAAAALALVALDALTGAESHVTRAVGDGPAALAGDLRDRLELSWRRATGSPGALAVVFGGLAVLAGVLVRGRPSPLRDALLAAIAVSLLVNDTATDVAGVGAVVALVAARAWPLLGERQAPELKPVFDPFVDSRPRGRR